MTHDTLDFSPLFTSRFMFCFLFFSLPFFCTFFQISLFIALFSDFFFIFVTTIVASSFFITFKSMTLSSFSNQQDIFAVILRINRYFNAIDERDFDYALDCFEENFDADYTSMVGGEPMKALSRLVNLQAWNGMLAGFQSTHHLIGNHDVIFIDADSCHLKLKVTATHCLKREQGDEELWITGGTYSLQMVRSQFDNQWRISSIKFTQAWHQGSSALMQEAAKICAQRNQPAS
jgi:hypothetical protein